MEEIKESIAKAVESAAKLTSEAAVAVEAPKKRPGRRKKAEEPAVEEAVKKKPGRKPAAKKAETVAEAAAKEETPKKRPGRKPAAKKAADPEVSIVLQYQEKEVAARDIVAAATESFRGMRPDVEIKSIDVYVKPEEGVAYYVVNGEGSDDYKIEW